ncbi:MAG: sarcosine oxidase subunit delta [Chloroflexi bacterium]|nr:sarcosine oxidase subunit delta [Chloroflexota bacterium]
MSFLINCPNCGDRGFIEFGFGGEAQSRPAPDASDESWTSYVYRKGNHQGMQTEWWYHRFGCRLWFLVNRNTKTNEVVETAWPKLKDGKPAPAWKGK